MHMSVRGRLSDIPFTQWTQITILFKVYCRVGRSHVFSHSQALTTAGITKRVDLRKRTVYYTAG